MVNVDDSYVSLHTYFIFKTKYKIPARYILSSYMTQKYIKNTKQCYVIHY